MYSTMEKNDTNTKKKEDIFITEIFYWKLNNKVHLKLRKYVILVNIDQTISLVD